MLKAESWLFHSSFNKGQYVNIEKDIVGFVLKYHPDIQAIYIFGSYGTEYKWDGSDVDIALLFHPHEAHAIGSLAMSDLLFELESELKITVDIVNLRLASTVFQKEVITTGCLLYCGDDYAVAEFEMLVFSYYQKLNEERAVIIRDALSDGRFHKV